MKNLVGVALVSCCLLSVGGGRLVHAQKMMTIAGEKETPVAKELREGEEAAKKEKERKAKEAEASKEKGEKK